MIHVLNPLAMLNQPTAWMAWGTQLNPQIVIEAKLTEDDGTTRDKVTRVQHLGGA